MKTFTHEDNAVAIAIPDSLKDFIRISDKKTLIATLTIAIYSGVLVSSLAKKQVTNT